jgi:hypothetical protein
VGWGGRKSAVLGLEFLHEAGEGVNGVHADGVVDAGAAAADGAVAFEANHVQGGGFLDELGFEFFAGEAPGDVHDGAEFVDGAATVVAAGVVNGAVELVGFGAVDFLDAGGAAFGEEPAGDEHQDVDAEGGGGVVEGVFLGLRAVLHHGGERFGGTFDEVLADDDEGDAGGAEVFLRAGIDEAELLEVELAREDVAGHVANEGGRGVGIFLDLGAGDGFVGGDVDVGGVGGVVQRVVVGHVGGDFLGGVGEDVDLAYLFGFLDGFAGPCAGVDVVGGLAGAEEVEGDLRELEAGAALEEQDLVVVGRAEEFGHVGEGFGVDGVVGFATVAVFHDGHAGAVEINQLFLGDFEDFEGKRGGAGVEVECSAHENFLPDLF